MIKEWDILNIESHIGSGGVVKVDAIYKRVDSINFISSSKFIFLNFEYDTSNNEFIQFENLKKTDVINWVKSTLDSQEVEAEVLKEYKLKLKKSKELETSNSTPPNWQPKTVRK